MLVGRTYMFRGMFSSFGHSTEQTENIFQLWACVGQGLAACPVMMDG